MNSTALFAPVVTAWVEAPVNQKITAPPIINPKMVYGLRRVRIVSGWTPSVFWIINIKEKIIVVAPTTAVPIKTGLAVALNVFPAPSFDSR